MGQQPTNDQPVVKLEIEVTAETSHDLGVLIAEEGWDYTEGLRIILGAGMAAIRAERAQQALISGSEAAEHIQRMHKRLVGTESSLAVTRFRLYEALKTIQNWELSSGATRIQNTGYQGLIHRQKEELDELKDRLHRQEEELVKLRLQIQMNPQEAPPTAEQKKGWKEKLGWKQASWR